VSSNAEKSHSAVTHDYPRTLATPYSLRRGVIVSVNYANLLCQHKSGVRAGNKDISARITTTCQTIHIEPKDARIPNPYCAS